MLFFNVRLEIKYEKEQLFAIFAVFVDRLNKSEIVSDIQASLFLIFHLENLDHNKRITAVHSFTLLFHTCRYQQTALQMQQMESLSTT